MNDHTDEYLKKQPLWHDCDLLLGVIISFTVGFFIGMVIF